MTNGEEFGSKRIAWGVHRHKSGWLTALNNARFCSTARGDGISVLASNKKRAAVMDKSITFTLNGQLRAVTTHPERLLLEVLREDLDLTGTKYGCGESQCGACTVLVDGVAVRSCARRVASVAGKRVTTIER